MGLPISVAASVFSNAVEKVGFCLVLKERRMWVPEKGTLISTHPHFNPEKRNANDTGGSRWLDQGQGCHNNCENGWIPAYVR